MSAWYNENDPRAAAWLRELIRRGLIADGDVDERSIEDIAPYEIALYDQCHFFAGIGVWSYALRRAGWDDSRRVWTGSCPCQPYSQAGKGDGMSDERHLWPAWEHLVRELNPPVIFGEQVASSAAAHWTDLVQDDLEALGYAFGAVAFPAASVGAPHIRDRQYWVADSEHAIRRTQRLHRKDGCDGKNDGRQEAHGIAGTCGEVRQLADSARDGRREEREIDRRQPSGDRAQEMPARFESSRSDSGLENTDCAKGARLGEHSRARLCEQETAGLAGPGGEGYWMRGLEWLECADQKFRPTQSGLFPLAHGAPARVGRLRGYGNAIVAQAAAAFIEAYLAA